MGDIKELERIKKDMQHANMRLRHIIRRTRGLDDNGDVEFANYYYEVSVHAQESLDFFEKMIHNTNKLIYKLKWKQPSKISSKNTTANK